MAVTGSHYRFGIDELAESTHGWHAAEDANPAAGVIQTGIVFLLRFTEQADGTAASNEAATFQYNKNGAGWVTITTTSSVVKAIAAAALTNGGNCTKRLSGTGTFETTGAGQTETGASGGNANDIVASGNSETECGLQVVTADVALGDTIQFRITGSPTAITMSVTPTLTIGAVVKSATESVRAGFSEAQAILFDLMPTESLRVAASEVAEAVEVGGGPTEVSATDTVGLGLSDVVAPPLIGLIPAESMGVVLSELVDRLLAFLDPAETVGVRMIETPDTSDVRVSPAETLVAGLTDATDLLARIDPAGEAATVGLTETTSAALLVAAAEALAAVLAESAADVLPALSDTDSIRVALSEAIDALDVRLSDAETMPAGLLEVLDRLVVTLTDAEALRLAAGDSLTILIETDAGETIPVTLALEVEAPVAILDAADTMRVGAGSYGEAEGQGGGGGGGMRWTIQVSWPRQHEQWGGPP